MPLHLQVAINGGLDAAQMQALNPLLVMLLIPFNNIVLYPLLRKMGFVVTALRRMGYSGRMTGHGFRSLASTILNEQRKYHPDGCGG